MKIFDRINKSDWKIIGGFWLIAIPVIAADYSSHMKMPTVLKFLLIDFVAINIVSLGTVFILAPKFLTKRKYFLFFMALLMLLIGEAIIYGIGYSMVWPNWKLPESIILFLGDEITSGAQSLGILGGVLLAKKWFESQQDILKLEASTKANELRALQSQINPHFLFNNLNSLDELIDSRPEEAKKYVNRLAQLYRYLLNSKDEDVVTIKEEIDFAENYIYLLKLRYGNAYHFDIVDNLSNKDKYLIPPASLQLIIENVVKHNIGSIDHPLKTTIALNQDNVTVTNTKRLKRNFELASKGTGINNLQTRYALLSNKNISIEESETEYKIVLPLINLLNS